MNEEFDIVIVGGGIVGCSLARALKDSPLKIAIVEKFNPESHPQTNGDHRTLALSHSSQRIYNTLGLWPQLKDKAVPIKQIHISAQGHFGSTRLNSQSYYDDLEHFAYMIEMQQLTRLLLKSCRSNSAIKWFAPAQLTQIETMKSHQQLTLSMNQKEKIITAKLIIAADGTNSVVRKLLNIKAHEKEYGQTAIVGNIGLGRSHHNVAYERFTRNGAIAMLPIHDQQSAMVWAVPDDIAKELLSLSDQAFLDQLQKNFGYRLGRFIKLVKRSCFPLKLVQTRQVHKGGTIFIGNAAQSLHPIAAQGFNLGLRDVAAMAQVIGEVQNKPNELGTPEMIKKYDALRKWDKRGIVMCTDLLVRTFTYESVPVTVFRSSLLLMLDRIKPIKKAILKHTMGMSSGLTGRLPDLVCGLKLDGWQQKRTHYGS